MKLRRRQTLLNATHLVGSPTDARLVWPVLKPKALLYPTRDPGQVSAGQPRVTGRQESWQWLPCGCSAAGRGGRQSSTEADFIHSFLDGGQDAPNMPQVTAPPHGILNGTQKGHRFSSSTQFPTTKYNLSNSRGVSLFPQPNPRGILMPYRPPLGSPLCRYEPSLYTC